MDFTQTGPERMLMVQLAARRFALAVSEVESVVTVRRGDIGSVPFDTSGRIRGLFTDRGSVVPLVRRAGLTAAADADGSETLTCVILRDGGRRFALAVDRAEKVESVSPDASAPRLTAHTLYTGEADDGDDWRQ